MIVRIHIGRAIARLAMATLVALVVSGMARPAAAQGAAPNAASPAPSPAALLLARQILETKHVEDIFKPLIR